MCACHAHARRLDLGVQGGLRVSPQIVLPPAPVAGVPGVSNAAARETW